MGVLEPFPTSTVHPTSTSTVEPTPTPEPETAEHFNIFPRDSKKVFNPVRQVYCEDTVFAVQGFVAGGTGLDNQTVKYKVFKYNPDCSQLLPSKIEELDITVKNSSGRTSDLNLTNPFWIDARVSDGETDGLDDDILYLAITDLGSNRCVYVVDMGMRSDGWTKGTARDVNANNATTCSVPLTCSLGIDMVYWVDYTEEGKVVAYSYKDIADKSEPTWCGTAIGGLSYPAVVDAHGPWGAVTCQGDEKICLFKMNQGDNQKDLAGDYPLLTTGEALAFIYPENASYKCPFDLAWTHVNDPKNNYKDTYFLTITSGLTVEGYGPASQPADQGALWLFKDITDQANPSLEEVNKNSNNKYKLLVSGLQYPVSPTFPGAYDSGRKNLDIIFAQTGRASYPKSDATPGSIEFVRYDLSKEKIDRNWTQTAVKDLKDPFSVFINTSKEEKLRAETQNENITAVYYNYGWNYGTDTSDNGAFWAYVGYTPTKK
ncbi:hypothetical protein IJT93_08300 [bacterium]|nr:hypothetical protein [bacterium]